MAITGENLSYCECLFLKSLFISGLWEFHYLYLTVLFPQGLVKKYIDKSDEYRTVKRKIDTTLGTTTGAVSSSEAHTVSTAKPSDLSLEARR